MKLIAFAGMVAAACIVLAGCGPETHEAPEPAHHEHGAGAPAGGTAPGPEQPASHHRMLEELAAIAVAAEQDNQFMGQGQARQFRADRAALPPDATVPERWLLSLLVAGQELRLGNEELSLALYDEAYRLLGQARDPVPAEYYVQTVFEMGVAHMRRAETLNCVERHTSDSCLFPIQGSGVHVNPENTREAARLFSAALEHAREGSREALRARWLLNVAHMTSGSYPDEVPPRYLIPPGAFASDEPFPRFSEVAPRAGLDVHGHAGAAIAEDFDGDGWLDVMFSTWHTSGNLRYFRNNGDGTFAERTEQAGLRGLYGGLNALQADYDNDGDADVLVLRGAWWRQLGRHPKSLLRNNGDGTFSDVTFDAGLGAIHYPTQTAAWADYDLDGDLDVFVGNESGKGIRNVQGTDPDATAPCQLFRNDGDGTFTDVAAAAGVQNLRYTKGAVWGDYDNDGDPDLYASNGGHKNRLYRNDGDGTFTDVAEELGVTLPIAGFPTWFWDANNDGWLDLFVGAYGGPLQPPDVSSIAAGYLGLPDPDVELPGFYLGDGRGGFRDARAEWGLARRPTQPMGANHGDLDNDGWPDFYLGTGYPGYEGLMPNVMYRNRSGSGFADVTTAGGFGHLQKGHGVAFADLDNDGDQDVLAKMGGGWLGDAYASALFENPGFGGRWLKLSLVGVRSNRSGVGARIRAEIVDGGRRRSVHHLVSTGSSFGANPLRAEIGLGGARRIERLEIRWPARDSVQRFEDVAVDQWIEVTEGRPDYRQRPLRPVRLGGSSRAAEAP